MRFASLAATVALVASAFTSALPTEDASNLLQKRCAVAENNQSCTCSDSYDVEDGLGLRFYTVTVGRPFDATRCPVIKSKLAAQFPAFQSWECSETTCGWFHLKFEITNWNPSHATIINQVLAAYFPLVNGFNCPAY